MENYRNLRLMVKPFENQMKIGRVITESQVNYSAY